MGPIEIAKLFSPIGVVAGVQRQRLGLFLLPSE
jgi:hypothetical protein